MLVTSCFYTRFFYSPAGSVSAANILCAFYTFYLQKEQKHSRRSVSIHLAVHVQAGSIPG